MQSVTLLQIRTDARRDADMPGADVGVASDADYNGWINDAYRELYQMLVERRIGHFQTLEQAFVTDGLTEVLALPATFLDLVGVDYQVSAEQYKDLKPLDERDVCRQPKTGALATWYRLDGPDRLVLYPRPPIGQTYRLRYIRTPAVLAANGDTIDGVIGYERFIVAHAAYMASLKERTPNKEMLGEREAVRARIHEQATDRMLYEAGRIQDTESAVESSEGDYYPVRRGWM